ncbi:uncharacterized protein LOC103520381 [Diaphorina citri]|uniref:Uncharacterized protein LOC103520380 n=1 Tax=Diaphorina citri TaxID=121845 RepID=A0A1S3DKY5_DIACI|nr:uncharacterized protein LOC103520380 [Diaphorina citri]XP_008483691.1 uncharacterized protein LOC103520381 [Diaphorina citri]
MSHPNFKLIEETLQIALNNLVIWTKNNGSKFSEEKTKVVVFSKRKTKFDLNLNFNGVNLNVSNEMKLLGMIMDYRLTWKDHIIYTKAKAMKAMNILKILNNRNNGVNRKVLLRLYKTYVRPIIEYGAPIYNSAPKAILNKLDPIQNTAIRIATGAFKSSRIENLLVDAGEPPLHIRREYLSNNYMSKVLYNVDNPMRDIILSISPLDSEILFQNHPKPLSLWFYENTNNLAEILPDLRLPNNVIPPWTLLHPKFEAISTKGKKHVLPIEFRNNFYEYLSNKRPSNPNICYTDGSKNDDTIGAAFKIADLTLNHKLHKMSSSFTAEAFAMEFCLSHLIKNNVTGNIIIFTDSKSLLAAMQQDVPKNVIIHNIQELSHCILSKGNQITITWIPSHCGIPGNEEVDLAAKSSNFHTISKQLILPDLKNFLKSLTKVKWQSWWDNVPFPNKIKNIKLSVHPWPSSNRTNRLEEKILCRLRIGHTRLTHKYLMERSDPPICDTCMALITVEHLLCDCVKYIRTRQKFNIYDKQINEILGDNPPIIDKVMKFLKEINVYKEI